MTSRARKIVLAMYGHGRERAFDKAIERTTDAQWDMLIGPARHCCYDAMDEPDVTDVAPRIVLGGNYGMPCA